MHVTIHWADLALTVAIVAAGCGASYVLLLRKMQRALEESHRELGRRLTLLTEAMTTLEAGAPVSSTDALAAQEMEDEAPAVEVRMAPAAPVEVEQTTAEEEIEELSPEIQAAIAAAAIAMLGNNARVRATRRIPSRDVVSPWTQQGRVIVQSSHNLRTRK